MTQEVPQAEPVESQGPSTPVVEEAVEVEVPMLEPTPVEEVPVEEVSGVPEEIKDAEIVDEAPANVESPMEG